MLAVYISCEPPQPLTRAPTSISRVSDACGQTESALSALLSRLRQVVSLDGRSEIRLLLPANTWVDVEAAAEACPAPWGERRRARGLGCRLAPARVAQHVCERPFLPGETSRWAMERAAALGAMLVRALELAGLSALRIGGSELNTAERARCGSSSWRRCARAARAC